MEESMTSETDLQHLPDLCYLQIFSNFSFFDLLCARQINSFFCQKIESLLTLLFKNNQILLSFCCFRKFGKDVSHTNKIDTLNIQQTILPGINFWIQQNSFVFGVTDWETQSMLMHSITYDLPECPFDGDIEYVEDEESQQMIIHDNDPTNQSFVLLKLYRASGIVGCMRMKINQDLSIRMSTYWLVFTAGWYSISSQCYNFTAIRDKRKRYVNHLLMQEVNFNREECQIQLSSFTLDGCKVYQSEHLKLIVTNAEIYELSCVFFDYPLLCPHKIVTAEYFNSKYLRVIDFKTRTCTLIKMPYVVIPIFVNDDLVILLGKISFHIINLKLKTFFKYSHKIQGVLLEDIMISFSPPSHLIAYSTKQLRYLNIGEDYTNPKIKNSRKAKVVNWDKTIETSSF